MSQNLKQVAEYREVHPEIVIEILEFFDGSNMRQARHPAGHGTVVPRTVREFLEHLRKKQPDPSSKPHPQPEPINTICRRMEELGWLSSAGQSTGLNIGGVENAYVGTRPTGYDRDALNKHASNIIYGWACIYDTYRPAVIPVLHEAADGASSIGTAFVTGPHTVVTAAHCIVGAKTVAVRGVAPLQLQRASVYVSANDAVDLAVLRLGDPVFADCFPISLGHGNVLDDVMVLGYPNVPGFHPTLAAEKATISSRFTAVRGAVASSAEEIFTRSPLFLITARVRGGFSGGPVLNSQGVCVGVVSREPASQSSSGMGSGHHLYDNLGYGTAIPTNLLEGVLVEVGANTLTHSRLLGPDEVSWADFS